MIRLLLLSCVFICTSFAQITRTALLTDAEKDGVAESAGLEGNLAVGDLFIVIAAVDTTTSRAVRYYYDGANFESLTLAVRASNTGNVITEIWYCVVQNAAVSSAFLHFASGTNEAIALARIKVTGLTNPTLDQTSPNTGSSDTPSSNATPTTTEADEILIGAVGTEGPDGDTAGSWSNGFNNGQRQGTTGGSQTSNVTISEGYLIVSATGAYTAAKTGITSRDWGAAIATFKSGSAVVAPKRLTLLGVGD